MTYCFTAYIMSHLVTFNFAPVVCPNMFNKYKRKVNY